MKLKKGFMSGAMMMYITLLALAIFVFGVIIQGVVSGPNDIAHRAVTIQQDVTLDLATQIVPIELWAEDGTDNNNDESMEYFYFKFKLAPDSYDIRLDQLTVYYKTGSTGVEEFFNYSPTINCSLADPADETSIYNETNKGLFGSKIDLLEHSGLGIYTLRAKDVVTLCFKTQGKTPDSDTFRLHLHPKLGTPLIIEYATPQYQNRKRVQYYPPDRS